jgi:hypothetical protein
MGCGGFVWFELLPSDTDEKAFKAIKGAWVLTPSIFQSIQGRKYE